VTRARGMSAPEHETPVFPHPQNIKNRNGGFDVNPDILDWNKRRLRILSVIAHANFPDIVAMEEMDQFADFFYPAMFAKGYQGICQYKLDATGANYGYWSDGSCVFWKTAMFTLLADHSGNLGPSDPNPFVLLELLHVTTKQKVLVAATHLKSKSGLPEEKRRTTQIHTIMTKIETFGVPLPVIIMGDFNTDPYTVKSENKTDPPNSFVDPTCYNSIRDAGYASAYHIPVDKDNATERNMWTTSKSRKGINVTHMIDYIMFKNLELKNTLEIPTLQALPSATYPSDHLAIGAAFSFTGQQFTIPIPKI
jgi:endonuclease/exonuclease/phosphatase family metal-dependent hydrolase